MELEKYIVAMRDSGRFTDQQLILLRQKIIDRAMGYPSTPTGRPLGPEKPKKVKRTEWEKYVAAMRQKPEHRGIASTIIAPYGTTRTVTTTLPITDFRKN